MTAGERLSQAAQDFVGVPFRLHGRDPSTGLDCVGLIAASLKAIGRTVVTPRGYRLRNASITHWLENAATSGLHVADDCFKPGDVLLVRPAPAQHHLMITSSSSGVIHAHAGLGRVVIQPFPHSLEVIAHWRLIDTDKDI